MYAAVIKLYALTNAVRAAAEHHDLPVVRGGHLVFGVIGGIVIGRVLDTADGDRLPGVLHPQGYALVPDGFLRNPEYLS